MRKANVFLYDKLTGILVENEDGYSFTYDQMYLQTQNPLAISNNFPVREKPYTSTVLFPFFDGLIPEGWLLDIAEKNWKINPNDRMGLLLACCKDCIGAVSIQVVDDE